MECSVQALLWGGVASMVGKGLRIPSDLGRLISDSEEGEEAQ